MTSRALTLSTQLYFVYWLLRPVVDSFQHIPAVEYIHTFVDPNASVRLAPFSSPRIKCFYPQEPEKKQYFPSIMSEPSVSLSLIVPAYQEQARLPVMLEEVSRQFLNIAAPVEPHPHVGSMCFE